MTNPKGVRRGTRDLFARKFKKRGVEPLTTYLTCYKIGQLVDIKGNGAFQKGMPHKSYHGKTGRVFNITGHSLGVVINKKVRGRVIAKRINVRVEHVSPSRCRDDHIARIKRNDDIRRECLKTGKRRPCLKRSPQGPYPAHYVDVTTRPPELIHSLPYEFVV